MNRDMQVARAIFCAVNECDAVKDASHIEAAFAGRPGCNGAWISAQNAVKAAQVASALLLQQAAVQQ